MFNWLEESDWEKLVKNPKFTMPNIRGILVAEGVSIATLHSRTELLEAFKTNVYSRRQDLLKEKENVKRSSEGIEDAPGHGSGS